MAVIHDYFEGASRAQAKLLGIDDLKIAALRRPRATDTEEMRREAVKMLFEQVVNCLTAAAEPEAAMAPEG
ncbi:MAG: hypothetical protein HYX92_02950 [Chloroflexi bacterium]|nr:hypothetical protein [Chloroflexota bacterium]